MSGHIETPTWVSRGDYGFRMTQKDTPTSAPTLRLPADQWATRIVWARRAGVILAAGGFLDGLIMALDRRAVGCPGVPQGATDLQCFVHPEAPEGIAIATISVLLGILIVLTSVIAHASVGSRTPN